MENEFDKKPLGQDVLSINLHLGNFPVIMGMCYMSPNAKIPQEKDNI